MKRINKENYYLDIAETVLERATCLRREGWERASAVTIGDNVWLGGSVTILPGVTIGSDVVIAAGSVVNRDIPDHVVAGGNPCRVIRPITEADRYTNFDRFGSDT